MFCRRNIDLKSIDIINQILEDKHETDDINIYVSPDKEQVVYDLLRKHERIWSAQLGEIKATELRIELKANARTLKDPVYRAVPKTRELEQSEINKQLKAVVI